MFNWLKEYLEIRYQFKQRQLEILEESKICKSCDTLRTQLEIANFERKQLLDALITPKPITPEPIGATTPEQLKPKNIPWAVRRQMLEAEDREKAKILNAQAKHEQELKLAAHISRGETGGLNYQSRGEAEEQTIEELERQLGIDNLDNTERGAK